VIRYCYSDLLFNNTHIDIIKDIIINKLVSEMTIMEPTLKYQENYLVVFNDEMVFSAQTIIGKVELIDKLLVEDESHKWFYPKYLSY